MDEQVPIRHIRALEGMGVRDTDHTDGPSIRWGDTGRATEMKQRLVQRIEECDQRGGDQVVG